MNTLLKMTGLGKLVSFYRYIYLNGPGVSRWAGVFLILLVALIHLIEAPEHFEFAGYLGVLFLLASAGSVVAAVGVFRGARTWGWLLGAIISAVALVAYPISRFFGLPGFSEGVGAWDEPLGSLAMIVEALFLAGYFTVITGLNVAYPERRDWHD